MPDFKTACSYAASQGWLIVEDDVLTLTHGGAEGAGSVGRLGQNGAFARIQAERAGCP